LGRGGSLHPPVLGGREGGSPVYPPLGEGRHQWQGKQGGSQWPVVDMQVGSLHPVVESHRRLPGQGRGGIPHPAAVVGRAIAA